MFRTAIVWAGIASLVTCLTSADRTARGVELERAKRTIITLHSDSVESDAAAGFAPGDAADILRDFGIQRAPGRGAGLPLPRGTANAAVATGFRIDDGRFILSLLTPAMRQSASLRGASAAGGSQPMDVLAWDPTSNLAVLLARDATSSAAGDAEVDEQGREEGATEVDERQERTATVPPDAAADALPLAQEPARWGSPIHILSAWQPGSPAISAGIVSTETRFDLSVGAEVFLIDAIVPPAASGGPVVDPGGRVVGVVAAGGGGAAVPGTVIGLAPVRALITFVHDGGRGALPKPRLGVALQGTPEGVVIGTALAGSPAQEAGLVAGDRIVSIEDHPVRTPEQVIAAVNARRPGDALQLTIERDGQRQQLTVTLGQTPPQQESVVTDADGVPRPSLGGRPDAQSMTAEQLRRMLERQLGRPLRQQPPGSGAGQTQPPPSGEQLTPGQLGDQLETLSEQLYQLRQQLQQERQREPTED